MRYNLRNEAGDYFCYCSDGTFAYEWVPEDVLAARGWDQLIIYRDEKSADSESQMAISPKKLSGMMRPDYPDMTGARAVPETEEYLKYAEEHHDKV